MLKPYTREKNDQSDLTGHYPISEIDSLFVFIDRQFSHRWTYGRNATESFDKPCELIASTTLECTDPKAIEIRIF
jgi:hypothetical protein